MSIRVMTAVWDRGKKYEGGALLVLLALADWADDSGRCHPSVRQLAEKSRLTERQVYSVLGELKADGVLEKTGEVARRDGSGWRFLKGECGGRGRFIVYRINTEMLSGIPARKPEMNSGIEAVEMEKTEPETLKSARENPEVCDSALYRTVSRPSVKAKTPPPTPIRKRTGEGVDPLDVALTTLAEAMAVSEPRQRRRLREAIAQYCAAERMAAWEASQAMQQAWREYCGLGAMLRYRWGPVKFITHGHWARPGSWPIDEAKLGMAREARVGMA